MSDQFDPSELPESPVFTEDSSIPADLPNSGGVPETPPEEQEPSYVDRIGQTFGVDFGEFSSPADQERAAKMFVERFIADGMAIGQQVPQQQQAPQAQPQVAEEDEDETEVGGWDASDPKVQKQFKKLLKELELTKQQTQYLQQQLEQQSYQRNQGLVTEIQNRAQGTLDKFGSAKYGVGGQQSFSQQLARQNVLRMADAILNKVTAGGGRVPTVEQLIEAAAYYDGVKPGAKAANTDTMGEIEKLVNQQVPPAPKTTTSPFGGSPPAQQKKPVTHESQLYTNDSNYMAGARHILRRGR